MLFFSFRSLHIEEKTVHLDRFLLQLTSRDDYLIF